MSIEFQKQKQIRYSKLLHEARARGLPSPWQRRQMTIFYFAFRQNLLGPWKINSIGGTQSMFIRFRLFHVNNFNPKAHFASIVFPPCIGFLVAFWWSWKRCLDIHLPWGFFQKFSSTFPLLFHKFLLRCLCDKLVPLPLCQNVCNLSENHIVTHKRTLYRRSFKLGLWNVASQYAISVWLPVKNHKSEFNVWEKRAHSTNRERFLKLKPSVIRFNFEN